MNSNRICLAILMIYPFLMAVQIVAKVVIDIFVIVKPSMELTLAMLREIVFWYDAIKKGLMIHASSQPFPFSVAYKLGLISFALGSTTIIMLEVLSMTLPDIPFGESCVSHETGVIATVKDFFK